MHGIIKHPFGPYGQRNRDLVTGFAAFDELSLDSDELISVDDFMFLFTKNVDYPNSELNFGIDGVIGLNMYGYQKKDRFGLTHGMQGKTNLMKALSDNAVLMNMTVGLELN